MCADIEKSVFLKCVLQTEKSVFTKKATREEVQIFEIVCESSKSYAKRTGKQVSDREI